MRAFASCPFLTIVSYISMLPVAGVSGTLADVLHLLPPPFILLHSLND
jgi:D-alanyl-D-alanine carboxypeptidase